MEIGGKVKRVGGIGVVNDKLVMGKDKEEDTCTEKSQQNEKVSCKYLPLHDVDIVWDFRVLTTKTRNGLCVPMLQQSFLMLVFQTLR